MKIKMLLIGVGCLLAGLIHAQEIFAPTGDYFRNSSVSLSWTMGETLTETIAADDYQLTQGMQQTRFFISSIYPNESTIRATIFPNPTFDLLRIRVEGNTGFQMALFDMTGRELYRQHAIDAELELDVSSLATSVYVLKIWNEYGRVAKFFKITKL